MLAEHRDGLPMQGHMIAVEHAGLRQGEGAGVDGAESRAVAGKASQPVEQRLGDVLGRLIAGADDNARQRLDGRDGSLRRQGHAVAGLHLALVGGDEVPAVETSPAVLIGDAQRFDRQDQCIDREFRQQQEADLFGIVFGDRERHLAAPRPILRCGARR